MASIPQVATEVKCFNEGCHEPVFREGLCWDCFIADKEMEQDNEDAEREACLQGAGYIFGDHPLDGAWYGYNLEEVYR